MGGDWEGEGKDVGDGGGSFEEDGIGIEGRDARWGRVGRELGALGGSGGYAADRAALMKTIGQRNRLFRWTRWCAATLEVVEEMKTKNARGLKAVCTLSHHKGFRRLR